MYMLCIGFLVGVAASAAVVGIVCRVAMAREAGKMPDWETLEGVVLTVVKSPLSVEILLEALKDTPNITQRLTDSFYDWDK